MCLWVGVGRWVGVCGWCGVYVSVASEGQEGGTVSGITAEGGAGGILCVSTCPSRRKQVQRLQQDKRLSDKD